MCIKDATCNLTTNLLLVLESRVSIEVSLKLTSARRILLVWNLMCFFCCGIEGSRHFCASLYCVGQRFVVTCDAHCHIVYYVVCIMHSYCLQLASHWFQSSCNFATMLLLLDGNLIALLCFIMMCRIKFHCEAHCAMCIVQSQWLLDRCLKLQVNLVQRCCYYSMGCIMDDFKQVLFLTIRPSNFINVF